MSGDGRFGKNKAANHRWTLTPASTEEDKRIVEVQTDIAKQAVRHYVLSPHEACARFFPLANQCGEDGMYGRLIRDQVQRIRSR